MLAVDGVWLWVGVAVQDTERVAVQEGEAVCREVRVAVDEAVAVAEDVVVAVLDRVRGEVHVAVGVPVGDGHRLGTGVRLAGLAQRCG